MEDAKYQDNEVFSGKLVCEGDHIFKIVQYIPDLVDVYDYTRQEDYIYDSLWDIQPKQTYANRLKEYLAKFQTFAGLPEPIEGYFYNKVILDAGCGHGRFSSLAASLDAKDVISVDASMRALMQARVSTGNPGNCHFIRANIFHLPFKTEFDYIFSLGVLHHTPDTKKAFDSIIKFLKTGGYITIYIYGKHTLPLIIWPLRIVSLGMNKEKIRDICHDLGFAYDPEVKAKIDLRQIFFRLGRFDVLGIKRITYEGLTTKYLWEHSLKEIGQWFKEYGVEMISSTKQISASGFLKRVGDEQNNLRAAAH